MTVTINDIVNLMEKQDGVLVNCCDDCDFYNLPCDFDDLRIDCGSDKICVLFEEEVLKLPIEGEFVYIPNDNDKAYYKEQLSYYRDNGFVALGGGEDIYVKYREDNPCRREAIIYNEAKEQGLEKFFAKEKFIGFCCIQERVIIHREEDKYYEKAVKMSESNESNLYNLKEFFGVKDSVDNFIIAQLLLSYKKEEVYKLLAFLADNNIGDLTEFNCGETLDGRFVLFDYCGYTDWKM